DESLRSSLYLIRATALASPTRMGNRQLDRPATVDGSSRKTDAAPSAGPRSWRTSHCASDRENCPLISTANRRGPASLFRQVSQASAMARAVGIRAFLHSFGWIE